MPPAERVAWSDLLASMDWRQGEHVSILGPTGSGKSVLALALLPQRRYVVALANKTRDSTLAPLVRRGGGWLRIKGWPPPVPPKLAPRVVVWPKPRSLAEAEKVQREAFYNVLDGVYIGGGWCVYIDEAYYLAEILHLRQYMKVLWQQGRSAGTSIVALSQRPAFVPLEMYSEATHVFLFRTRDRQSLKRLGEVGNVDPRQLAAVVEQLETHEFAYVDARTGNLAVSRVTK